MKKKGEHMTFPKEVLWRVLEKNIVRDYLYIGYQGYVSLIRNVCQDLCGGYIEAFLITTGLHQ